MNLSTRYREQSNAVRRGFLLDQWGFDKDEFTAIERAALDYLTALDNRRRSCLLADAVKEIDDHASGFAGRAIDLLSDMLGRAQKAADEEGIAPEDITYDDSALQAEFTMWETRARARQ